jgi:hypothetical protein
VAFDAAMQQFDAKIARKPLVGDANSAQSKRVLGYWLRNICFRPTSKLPNIHEAQDRREMLDK